MRRSLIIALSLTAFVACTDKGDDEAGDSEAVEDTAPPPNNDADGDTILDLHEGEDDADGDGTPNYLDEDSDGDGLLDKNEAGDDSTGTMPFDTDLDGTPDYLDLDSDANGVPDSVEAGSNAKKGVDTDGDGTSDYRDFDNDGDNITDLWEAGPDGLPIDTDLDGTDDYLDDDSDNDLLCDVWEGGTTAFSEEPIDTDEDGVYDFRDSDSDGDGFTDTQEASAPGCGEPNDTDGDGTYDSQDLDADGDGLTDADEVNRYGTDPYDSDSDGDGQTDGAEIAASTDPLDADSVIVGVYVEVPERTTKETVFDFEPKIQYGDIGFLIDTTCSMSSTIQTTADRFGEIVTELDDTFENMAFGLATFDDYNYGSMGSSADKPFILLQQMTDSQSNMQTQLNSIPQHSGADGQESDMEALYQGATGAGYDQDCDGAYDAGDDIPPFIADSSDPFGGSATGTYDASVSGTGTHGGFGFRDYALPVMIYATDIYMRDPNYSLGAVMGLTATPGGCPQDAGSDLVVTSLEDLGGYIIGVDVGSYGTTSPYGPYDQMIDLAQRTNSYADLDGDGEVDDELVFVVPQGGSSFAEEFKNNVVTAVEQLVASVQFTKIHLEIEGDTYGMIESIDPEYYEDIDYEGIESLSFTLNFVGTQPATTEDQFFVMTLNVIGDDTLLLDTLDIVVVVPGTSH
jgi:hypothetical protein